jgi:unsaturated chondroitin disaccharide hydrolase
MKKGSHFVSRVKVLVIAAMMLACLIACSSQKRTIFQLADEKLALAARQYDGMVSVTHDSAGLPRTYTHQDKYIFAPSQWWTSGFIPGSLWYLYENDRNPNRLVAARWFTAKVEKEKYNRDTHDLGFMLYCSFGNGYRISGEAEYRNVMLIGAKSLASRYNPRIGCIQSWNKNAKWQYPVIIDNMMNLELLMWAFKQTGDSTYAKICITHADHTIKNHYRPDFSCYHVVSYDTLTGGVQVKNTHQGAFDESAWARGQAWGLYGFTMLHRETGLSRYLVQAEKVANFLIHHPNMPADGIPYWDFNAPGIPDEERDSSAGSIMASALLELSTLVEPGTAKGYREFAEKQIRSLSSDEYFAQPGRNGYFILKHGVGHKPGKSEVDVPLTYGDYYYIEALLRLKKMIK